MSCNFWDTILKRWGRNLDSKMHRFWIIQNFGCPDLRLRTIFVNSCTSLYFWEAILVAILATEQLPYVTFQHCLVILQMAADKPHQIFFTQCIIYRFDNVNLLESAEKFKCCKTAFNICLFPSASVLLRDISKQLFNFCTQFSCLFCLHMYWQLFHITGQCDFRRV